MDKDKNRCVARAQTAPKKKKKQPQDDDGEARFGDAKRFQLSSPWEQTIARRPTPMAAGTRHAAFAAFHWSLVSRIIGNTHCIVTLYGITIGFKPSRVETAMSLSRYFQVLIARPLLSEKQNVRRRLSEVMRPGSFTYVAFSR